MLLNASTSRGSPSSAGEKSQTGGFKPGIDMLGAATFCGFTTFAILPVYLTTSFGPQCTWPYNPHAADLRPAVSGLRVLPRPERGVEIPGRRPIAAASAHWRRGWCAPRSSFPLRFAADRAAAAEGVHHVADRDFFRGPRQGVAAFLAARGFGEPVLAQHTEDLSGIGRGGAFRLVIR